MAGEADVCSVFFTRLHQRNRQLQSRIKAYEDAISLQVQSIFVSGVCGHSFPLFLMSGFHGMNVRCAVCWGARVTFGYACVRARTSTTDHMQAGTPLVRAHHVCTHGNHVDPSYPNLRSCSLRPCSCAHDFYTRTKPPVAQEDAGKKANAEIHLKASEIQNLQGELAALKVFVCVYTSTLIYITHEYSHEQVRAGTNMHVRTSIHLLRRSLFKLGKP